MRIHEVLPLCLQGTYELVEVSHEAGALKAQLRPADDVPYTWAAPNDARDLSPAAVVVAMLGPKPPVYEDLQDLTPVLRRMQPGARAILLLGWPIEAMPYHRLLDPLSDASCQALAAVPVEESTIFGGVRSVLLVECVDKLVPLRGYLTDLPSETAALVPADQGDELRFMLRLVNEYVLGDLVARPMRKRLVDLGDRERELTRQLGERDTRTLDLEERLQQAKAEVEELQAQLTALEASTPMQVGKAVLDNVQHPRRALVRLPHNVAEIWRLYRAR